MVDTEFPHPVDWIFGTMFPGQPDEPSLNRQQTDILAIVHNGTSAARDCSRSFLFQSALSVCDFGGTAAYFVKERMCELPQFMAEMPFPDIGGLKKLELFYRATLKELVRGLVQMSQTPSKQPIVLCIEDLASFCEATASQRVGKIGFLGPLES